MWNKLVLLYTTTIEEGFSNHFSIKDGVRGGLVEIRCRRPTILKKSYFYIEKIIIVITKKLIVDESPPTQKFWLSLWLVYQIFVTYWCEQTCSLGKSRALSNGCWNWNPLGSQYGSTTKEKL